MQADDTTNTQWDIICLGNYRGLGGAQKVAGRMADSFQTRGYKAKLVFLYDGADGAGTFENSVVLAPEKPRGLKDWVRLLMALRREVISSRPSAIFGFFPFSNVVGALCAAVSRRTICVASLHNPAKEQGKWPRMLDRWLGQNGFYRKIICVSEAVKRTCADYPQSYRKRLVTVYNSVSKLPQLAEDTAACRRKLGLPTDRPILGTLGRLHYQKNIALAIDALAATKRPDIMLIIAGTGPDQDDLEKKVSDLQLDDQVIFLGAISGADVTRFYRSIDILLFPSRYEGFPLTLIEAFSQGTPVICSEIEVFREGGGDAICALPTEPAIWADKIVGMLNDKESSKVLVAAGYERARTFSDHDVMIDGYLEAAGLPMSSR